MKKLILLLSMLLVSYLGFSQATNVGEFRIANATTTFDQNLPVGTKVYDINTGNYWVATAGVASTATLTTASGSFTQLNAAGGDGLGPDGDKGDITVGGTGTTLTIDAGAIDETQLDASTNASLDLADSALQSEVDGSISNEGSLTVTAGTASTSVISSNTSGSTDVTLEAGANVSISEVGNTITIAATGDGTGTDDQNLSLGTVTATTMDVNIETGTNATLTAATNSAAGVATAAQITKLEGIATGAEVNLTSITEAFEEDDGTATAHSLAQTAVTAEGCRVSINGATLRPADYTFTTTTITIDGPVYQYDQVVITYFY